MLGISRSRYPLFVTPMWIAMEIWRAVVAQRPDLTAHLELFATVRGDTKYKNWIRISMADDTAPSRVTAHVTLTGVTVDVKAYDATVQALARRIQRHAARVLRRVEAR